MKRKSLLRAIVLVIVLGALLATGVAYAQLKITAVLRAWDDSTNQYENGFLVLYLDGQPEPFHIELGFDTDLFVDSCAAPGTPYAGTALMGMYHTDSNPAGAPGFVKSYEDSWALVDCSLIEAAKYRGDNPSITVEECYAASPYCRLTSHDVVTSCSTGNCADEIISTLTINLDADCDGNLDAPFAAYADANGDYAGGLCLYWEAQKPPFTVPFWKGNIQARVRAPFNGDTTENQAGDKTINFSVLGPNAVRLSGLAAGARSLGVPAIAAVIALGALAVAVVVYRRR